MISNDKQDNLIIKISHYLWSARYSYHQYCHLMIEHDINININIMTRPVSMCFEGEIVQLPRLQHSWHISSSLRPVLQGRIMSSSLWWSWLWSLYFSATISLLSTFVQIHGPVCETKLHVQQVCVRREEGYCKIGWIQTSDTDSFKLSRPSTNYKVHFLYF